MQQKVQSTVWVMKFMHEKKREREKKEYGKVLSFDFNDHKKPYFLYS